MKTCHTPRCPTLTRDRYCPPCATRHAAITNQAYDADRGTASQRGYGSRWRRYRTWFLAQYPLCGMRPAIAQHPSTWSRCLQEGRSVAASVVDHTVPITGPTDPRFFDPLEHEALCKPCHDRKRQYEARHATR